MRIRVIPIALAAALAACASDSSPGGDTSDTSPFDTMASGGAGVGPDAAAGAPGAPGAPGAAAGVSPGTDCAATHVTGDSVGPLRIGGTVAQVRARCPMARDTTVPGPEGQPSHRIAVVMGGERVEGEVRNDRVWRVPVTSTRLRTADGLGVGTPLARLLELRDVRPAMGEGLYVLSPAHCGLSFQLRNPGGSLPPATTVEQLRGLPATTVVSRVLVTGCGS